MKIFLKSILLLLLGVMSVAANDKISIQLLWKHQFEFAGFYMAKEKGFYKEAGLEVQIKEFDFGIDIVSDVLSGKSDIGIGRPSLVLDKLRGKDIVLLGAIFQSSPYVLLAKQRQDLQDIEDFKNKKIMLSDDLESEATILSMMKIKNINSSDYIEVEHTFNINDLIDSEVDLMTTYLSNEPFHMIEKGVGFKIFDPKDYGFDFYADIVFTSQKYIDIKHKTLERFHEASLKGWTYAFSNIDETAEVILKKYNSQNKSKNALLYEAKILKSLAYKDGVDFGNISDLRIQEIANIYRLLGITNKSNENLKNLIYKPYKLSDIFYKIFDLQIFLFVIAFIVILVVFILYRQYILRKQNQNLEEIVEGKTKELRRLNENLEEKIIQRTEELIHAMKVKSNFLANMSHEIRTPLNGIVGFVDILYKNESDTEKQNKLKIIKESSSSLLTIINDILDFSKIENKKLDIESIPLEIRDVFKHIVTLFFDKAKEKNIFITLNIDDSLPKYILGDPTRIKQVFSNLLSNAIKFSNDENVIVVNINYLKKEKKLYCEVIDRGIGIEGKKIANIFNSFEQADGSVSRKYGGTGLGLAISKALVELMGGRIGVESQYGVGSKFYFTIDLEETSDTTADINTLVLHESFEEFAAEVLVVEDNRTNQMLLEMLLEELGLEADIANDGLEAIEAVKIKKYDIILMDENMPNMNGIEASKIIKTLDNAKDTVIIAVTANALKGDREKFLTSGMDDYLSKPIDADKFKSMLHKYL